MYTYLMSKKLPKDKDTGRIAVTINLSDPEFNKSYAAIVKKHMDEARKLPPKEAAKELTRYATT